MVEKVTKEERMVSLAIEKAKELIQAFQDGTTVEMEGDLQGEEVKLKSPKKNPAEEKIVNPVGKDEGYGYVNEIRVWCWLMHQLNGPYEIEMEFDENYSERNIN